MAKLKCPKGFICVSDGTTVLYLVVVVIAIVVVMFVINKTNTTSKSAEVIESIKEVTVVPPSPSIITDLRFSRSPQPLRNWESVPEFPPRGGIVDFPIGIRTQGLPEQYQSVGIISLAENNTPLPLYGRRTILSGDRWNYYTKTDQYNPVSVPVHRNRNCVEDIGCNELFTGDNVKIPSIKQEGTVDIYKIDGPKYIYGLI